MGRDFTKPYPTQKSSAWKPGSGFFIKHAACKCCVWSSKFRDRSCSYSTLYDLVGTTSKESPMPVFLKLGSHMIKCKYNTYLFNLFLLATAKVVSIVMVPSTLSRESLWCVQCWIASLEFFFFFVHHKEISTCSNSVLHKVYIQSTYLSCDTVVYSHFEELHVMFPSSFS